MSTIKVTADPMLRPIRAFYAHDKNQTHAEGICVAICDKPTLVIQNANGDNTHWIADLCEVTGEPMTEREFAEFRNDHPKLVTIDPEDWSEVERLTMLNLACYGVRQGTKPQATEIRNMQDALREYAKPTPPKPVVTPDMVTAMQEQVRLDRKQSAYWNAREIDHGGLSAVEAWLDSLADHLGVTQ